jgi:hypothetical protein
MPRSGILRAAALAAIVLTMASLPLLAQTDSGGNAAGRGLTVVRCDPNASTCEQQGKVYSLPAMGPAGRATVLSPDLRTTEVALDPAEYQVLIPGCAPIGPGVFACDSIHQYQHCRTLMFSNMVFSCHAPNPLDGNFAEARPAAAQEYELEVDSSARIKVTQGVRGFGQARGEAKVVLAIQPPQEVPGGWCLQRDRFLFFPTGPDGGVSTLDDTADCEAPLEFSFKPHDDDIVRAYDMCEEFAAWDSQLEETIEVVAAGLFHMRSADPAFVAQHESGVAIVAPYVRVSAPLRIDCAN